MVGFPRGTRSRPRRSVLRVGSIEAEERAGRQFRRSGIRKSNTLCLPGFEPVMNDDHATGEIGGFEVASGEKHPSAARAERFGSFPSRIHPDARAGSRPSRPTMTTRSAAALRNAFLPRRRARRMRAGRVSSATTARSIPPV